MPNTRSRANADAPPDWDIFDGYFDMASGEAEIDVDELMYFGRNESGAEGVVDLQGLRISSRLSVTAALEPS